MRFLITLAVSLLIVAAVLHFIYGRYDVHNLSNAFFVVGLAMFFASIMTITDASRMFVGIGYAFKSIFTRHKQKYGDYHKYQEGKQDKDSMNVFGLSSLFVSILYVVISVVLALHFI